MGHPSPEYTAEFKQRAVGLYRERGCTYAGLARLRTENEILLKASALFASRRL